MRAVLLGLVVAVLVALLGRSLGAATLGLIATILGVGLGGFVAGKWANSAGLYHGAVVGVGWIALEVLGAVPTARYAEDVLADTVTVIAIDAVTLLAGSLGGALARTDRRSSSDTGRGR